MLHICKVTYIKVQYKGTFYMHHEIKINEYTILAVFGTECALTLRFPVIDFNFDSSVI